MTKGYREITDEFMLCLSENNVMNDVSHVKIPMYVPIKFISPIAK